MADVVESQVDTTNGPHRVRVGGTGPAMMVIPGGPGWGTDYLIDSVVELIGGSHRLYFVDQRGAGRSPVGTGPLTVEAYVDDMAEIADHFGLDQFDILGHSFGGLQTMMFAITYPDRVHRMVLADSDGPERRRWEAVFAPGSEFDRRTKVEDQDEIARITADPSWMSDQVVLDRYLALAYRPLYADPSTAGRIKHGMDETRFLQLLATTDAVRNALSDWDIRADLKDVAAPTLLVYCRDSIHDPETPRSLHELLPDSKLVLVDGGHDPMNEDGAGFKAAVDDFYLAFMPVDE